MAAAAQAAVVDPKEAYFERLDAAMTAHGCMGSFLVVGVDSVDSDEEEEEEQEGGAEPVYTAEQIGKLRHVLCNDARDAAVTEASVAVLDEDPDDDDFGMYNTESGNATIAAIDEWVVAANRKRSLPARFDALFAVTWVLRKQDFWMHDNECWEAGGECEVAMNRLAAAWKVLLRRSDQELGIDAEFTRPGVEAMLEQLAAKLGRVERGDLRGYNFKWR